MARKPARPAALPTRDRILYAALRRFSQHSYEVTGLRDIAGDAGVDVSYVHRCFGSKERLFAEAVAEAMRCRRFPDGDADHLPAELARRPLTRADPKGAAIEPLDIIIRSLTSQEASRVLRAHIQADFLTPLAERLDPPDFRRAALIAALLTGVSILRNVLQIEPLAEGEGGELEELLSRCISGLMRHGPSET